MRCTLSILAILGIFLLPSCASVGAVIEGGKEFTTGVIDGSVKAVSTVSGAVLEDVSDVVSTTAEVTQGVVKTIGDEIDEQTDELQDAPKKD
jgi:hypothetical protein